MNLRTLRSQQQQTKTQQAERQNYENEKQHPQQNHRGDAIEMDTTGVNDIGHPRRRPRRDRL
jgi:hypothetical protein